MVKRIEQKRYDRFLMILVIFLVLLGCLEICLISLPFSLEKFGTPWHYITSHIFKLIIGLGGLFLGTKLNLLKIKKYSPWIFLLSIVFVGLVFLPKIGVEISGAKRWIGLNGFLIQPSEFLKISFIIYLAALLQGKIAFLETKEKSFVKIIPLIVIFGGVFLLLILQPDMSTLFILLITGIGMYFIGKTPWWHFLCLMGIVAILGIIFICISPYRVARLKTFLNPDIDPLGISYQIKQARIALGSGRVFGIEGGFALGLGRQKFGFLPQPFTDSIFAILGEEMGFVGCLSLILLFLIFIWRGLRISLKSENEFLKYIAFGITIWIGIQALFNIGGIVGVLPLGGVPLPFLSYGGSHLIAELTAVGILLNISKRV